MRLSKVFAAVAVVAASSASFAANTDLTHISAAPIPVVSSEASLNGGVSFGTVAGLEYIVSSTNPLGTFAAFCLEPTQHYFGAGPATFSIGTFTAAKANALSKLFTGAGFNSWASATDAVDTSVERVGLALAVWDIFTDGALDFNAGMFQATNNDGFGGAAILFAQNAYAAGNIGMAGDLVLLQSDEFQDMVIAVPEPSTYALLLAGLAGVGFVAGRRQKRA